MQIYFVVVRIRLLIASIIADLSTKNSLFTSSVYKISGVSVFKHNAMTYLLLQQLCFLFIITFQFPCYKQNSVELSPRIFIHQGKSCRQTIFFSLIGTASKFHIINHHARLGKQQLHLVAARLQINAQQFLLNPSPICTVGLEGDKFLTI